MDGERLLWLLCEFFVSGSLALDGEGTDVELDFRIPKAQSDQREEFLQLMDLLLQQASLRQR